jgi:ABC-type transport system involved in multi-copper enzyme maturation permease subunit
MPIYDLTYRGWRGVKTKLPAWYPILENTVRLSFRNRLLFWLYIACALPPIVACAILYIRYSVESAGGARMRQGMPRELFFELSTYFNFLSFQGGLAIAIAGVIGSQAIAGDRRGNALEAIFSRAITRQDYLWGRFLGIFVLVLGATLIPGLVIWYCDNAFSLDEGRLVKTLSYPFKIAASSILLASSASLLILAFSALIRRGWLAIAAYLAFLLLSSGIADGTAEALPREFDTAASLIRGLGYFPALLTVQREIYGLTEHEVHLHSSPWTAFATITVVGLLSWWTLLRKVKPIEVVS